jgi:hypothetical protein
LRDKLFEIRIPVRNIQNSDNQAAESAQAWVKTYSGGKPNYTQPEETFDGWPLHSGLPQPDEALMKRVMDGLPDMPIKVQDEREANYKSFAQSAQVIGIPKKEWVGLTDDEIYAVENEYLVNSRIPVGCGLYFAKDIEAKFKEKNT